MHLRLPGWGADGPTLEILEYDPRLDRLAPAVNRPGYGHLAFVVDDVAAAREAVFAAGGRTIGQVVTTPVGETGYITWAYVTDPEGNVIELQKKD